MLAGSAPFGCIADDVTGAVDLATRFRHAGLQVHLQFQASGSLARPAADVLVVGLKSRMKPVKLAVAESLAALDWLIGQGCTQFYLKYASTFDCTRRGNIGPVIEAAMSRLGVDFTAACPALPSAGRTTQGGTHFVDGVPLGESYMRHHPITPMRNSHLVPLLQGQTTRLVGLLPHSTVTRGSQAIQHSFARMRAAGYAISIIDAVTDNDMKAISAACARHRLVTGSSGLALAIMRNRGQSGILRRSVPTHFPDTGYHRQAVIAGSCSEVTIRQVATAAQQYSVMQIDPLSVASGGAVVDVALSWASRHLPDGPIVIFSTAGPVAVKKVHARLGARRAASMVERALAAIAGGLARLGVRQMIIAGGETSGAVVETLGIQTMELGPTIDSGVSWAFAKPTFLGGRAMALVLKPGNFGGPNLFVHAWNALDTPLEPGEPTDEESL